MEYNEDLKKINIWRILLIVALLVANLGIISYAWLLILSLMWAFSKKSSKGLKRLGICIAIILIIAILYRVFIIGKIMDSYQNQIYFMGE